MSLKSYLAEKSKISMSPDLAFWFPFRFCIHVKGDKYLIIAPEKPGWMTLDTVEYAFFQNLLAGRTIRQSIRLVMADLSINLIETVDSAYSVLNKIEENGFLEKTEPTDVISRQMVLRLTNHKIPFPYPKLYTTTEKRLHNKTYREFFSAMRALRPPEAVYRVRYLGWEKYSRNDLADLMREAHLNGLKNVLTVGRIPGLSKNLLDQCDLFEVHINSRKGVRKRLGSFTKLLKHGVRVVLRVFLTKENIENVHRELSKTLKRIDPEMKLPIRISILPPSGTNLVLEDWDEDRKVHVLSREIHSRLFKSGRLLFRADPRFTSRYCCEFGRDLSINPDGRVFVCPYSKEHNWNLFETAVNEILKESLELHRQASVMNMDECRLCDLRNICHGRCRLHYFKNGRLEQTDFKCSSSFRELVYEDLVEGS